MTFRRSRDSRVPLRARGWAALLGAWMVTAALAGCMPQVASESVAGLALCKLPMLYVVARETATGFQGILPMQRNTGADLSVVPNGFVALSATSNLSAIAADPLGRFVYVVDMGAPGTLFAVPLGIDCSASTGPTASIGTSTRGVHADPKGKFVYTAGLDNVVWGFQAPGSSGSFGSLGTA
ncbi:MAG TPA: hypothetical protein VF678_04815, partial [bacterium]